MEELTPQMTPEMYEELMANGGQPQGEVQPQGNMQPQGEVQQQPQPQPQPQQGDIDQAKDLLGIAKTEETVSQLQSQLQSLQSEKVQKEIGSKYPDVPFDVVEKEIEKIEKINPEMGSFMRSNPEGMDMAYKATQAAIKPQETPDNLTDGESGGGQSENLDEIVSKGEADDFNLGKFILGNK